MAAQNLGVDVLRHPAMLARSRKGVIIAWLKLRLHLHGASNGGPDERVSLRDVGVIGKLPSVHRPPCEEHRSPHSPAVSSVPANPPQASGTNQTRPDTLLRSMGQAFLMPSRSSSEGSSQGCRRAGGLSCMQGATRAMLV
jgi:hypothetical protein